MSEPVVLEVGARLTFASALSWPGWARSGRGEEAALEALAAYAGRYSPVAEAAGLALPSALSFEVVERLVGNATTDFGAPNVMASLERQPDAKGAPARRVALVRAARDYLDEVASGAPDELRKGPRGGGRDRDAILEHVLGAEFAYARKVGVREKDESAMRGRLAERLGEQSGAFPEDAGGWPLAYAARRIAWHVLDHAWEIEDRSEP